MKSSYLVSLLHNAVEFELVTDAGKTLTGALSFVASYQDATGRQRNQYQIRRGERGVFEVARWRRVNQMKRAVNHSRL